MFIVTLVSNRLISIVLNQDHFSRCISDKGIDTSFYL